MTTLYSVTFFLCLLILGFRLFFVKSRSRRMVLIFSVFLYILLGLYMQVLVKPFLLSVLNKLLIFFLPCTIVLSYSCSQSSFEELEEVSNPLFMEDPRGGVNPSREGSYPGPSIAPQGPSSMGTGSSETPSLAEVKIKLGDF